MAQLSDQSQKILRDLQRVLRGPSWLWRQRREGQAERLLIRLGEQREPAAIPFLVRHLFSSRQIRAAAAGGLHSVMAALSDDELITLERHVRGPHWAGWGVSDLIEWTNLRPASVDEIAGDGAARVSALGLLSFHRSGYVREAAVRRLNEVWDGNELPYLLLRTNDWVEPVAVAAQDAVRVRLTESYVSHAVRHLTLIVRLAELGRRDLSDLTSRSVELLTRDRFDNLLQRVVGSSDRASRRGFVQNALKHGGDIACRVIGHGLRSSDAVIRLWCARRVRDCYDDEALIRDVLACLSVDRSMPVRRQALLAEAENSADMEHAIWCGALLDASSAIRELARFRLRRLGDTNAAEVYRETLHEAPDSLPALSGLGESGGTSDLPLLRDYLKHSIPSRRSAAVRGIARIAGDAAPYELVKSVCDRSRTVTREAEEQLRTRLSQTELRALYEVANRCQWQHAREAALRLIFQAGKWRSLPWLVRGSGHWDEETRRMSAELVAAWFSVPYCNRVFTKPSEAEQAAIDEALTEIPHETAERFRLILAT